MKEGDKKETTALYLYVHPTRRVSLMKSSTTRVAKWSQFAISIIPAFDEEGTRKKSKMTYEKCQSDTKNYLILLYLRLIFRWDEGYQDGATFTTIRSGNIF